MHKLHTLNEWLEYIESAHSQAVDMGLDRVVEVYNRLSLDLSASCIVTVAGTNGKGTSCRFIEQASLRASYSVGVYSSPHIEHFNERIRVFGIDADDDTICNGFAKIYAAAIGNDKAEPISLSYFEYATLCALIIFAEAKVDICILEVGLGGRLDATNILDAHIGVITSIGLDHQSYLGDNTESIAAEKAGIIKPKQEVVIGYSNMQNSVAAVLNKYANQSLICDEDFGIDYREHDNSKIFTSDGWINIAGKVLHFDLDKAQIPAQNVMTAIATLQLISRFFKHPEALLLQTNELKSLIEKVGMPGRFETINQSPLIVLDVAHNEDSAEYLVSRMRKKQYNKCHIIIGMLKDKNIEATIDRLASLEGQWYCVDLPTERGEKAERLYKAVKQHQQVANKYDSVSIALQQAIVDCGESDIILVVGSFVLASYCMQAIEKIKP
jgi:dihydrofolate synthase/folylpolyglutamate synthase